jgi:hypothetical protein
MATWPASLPSPLVSAYQGDAGVNIQRTEMDAGAARQRLRYSDSPDELSMSWKFKPAEMEIFKAFWKTDINHGNDWFLMDLHTGDGLLTYEVRIIGGKYQYQVLSGLNWQVSAKIEIRTI